MERDRKRKRQMPISREPVKPALPKHHPLRRYGMAIAMVLAATLLRHFFFPVWGCALPS